MCLSAEGFRFDLMDCSIVRMGMPCGKRVAPLALRGGHRLPLKLTLFSGAFWDPVVLGEKSGRFANLDKYLEIQVRSEG